MDTSQEQIANETLIEGELSEEDLRKIAGGIVDIGLSAYGLPLIRDVNVHA